MRIIGTLDEMTETARGWLTGGKVGFVLLTGRIHEGNRVLLQLARKECEILVVCILDTLIIDPTVHKSTTRSHPQDILRDLRFPNTPPIDVVFIPQAQEMYPPDFSMYVTPRGPLVAQLSRVSQAPGLRKMVTTIIKLFQLVRPDIIFLAQKDALQIATFHQLIRDLNMDIRLSVIPTVRLVDGLAVSNRNQLLTSAQRQEAPLLYHALKNAQALIERGIYDSTTIMKEMQIEMSKATHMVSPHILVCHPDTLAPTATVGPNSVFILSAHAGSVQLIDAVHWLPDRQWRF